MFTLEFKTESDAFALDVAEECTRILKEVTKRVKKGHTGGSINDNNGNSIGVWRLKE